MNERAQSFGAAAAAYERFRPDYPDILVRLVEEYAGRPLKSALEIGAGTGKATKTFVRHGIPVMATDPNPAMLAELHDQVPAARTVTATLEELADVGSFDLVFAAASLHWTDADGRWDRIADLLVPGGVFANFGGQPQLIDAELEEAVRVAHQPWLADDSAPLMGRPGGAGMEWPATELMGNARFTDVRETTVEQLVELTSADYVGLLSTISAYLMLGEADRVAALGAVEAVLPDVVAVRGDLTVHLARRV